MRLAGQEVSQADKGWDFTDVDGEIVWSVSLHDGGPFPVFSSCRGTGEIPPRDDLAVMTNSAVSQLRDSAGLSDPVGWMTHNIAEGLLLASRELLEWEGLEWALESDDDDEPLLWASPDSGRVPFDWLRAIGLDLDTVIHSYQDDGVFGLSFVGGFEPQLPEFTDQCLRPRRDIPLAGGAVQAVEIVYDTSAEEGQAPGVVTEVLLHGLSSSTLLIAAEAYSRAEWRLYDESVVALSDPSAADSLDWIPSRQAWRSLYGPV